MNVYSMLRFLISLIIFLGHVLSASAQEAKPPRPQPNDTAVIEIPGIDVVASILSTAGPKVGSGLPARTSVITAAELRAVQPRLLPDALATQPGISIYDDLGSPYKRTLVMRGFTASPVVGLPQGVSVFVDGVPINEPDAGQVNFDLMPLEHVARVELLSGTASLLGPYSLGGAINLVTRRGEGPARGEMKIEMDSYGAYSAGGSLGRSARGWSYYAGGGYETGAGWRQRTSATVYDVMANVGRHGERRGISLQAFAARSRAETAGSLPLSVYTVRPDRTRTRPVPEPMLPACRNGSYLFDCGALHLRNPIRGR